MILESTGYVTAFSIESVYDVGTALRQSRILPEARVSISRPADRRRAPWILTVAAGNSLCGLQYGTERRSQGLTGCEFCILKIGIGLYEGQQRRFFLFFRCLYLPFFLLPYFFYTLYPSFVLSNCLCPQYISGSQSGKYVDVGLLQMKAVCSSKTRDCTLEAQYLKV
jgi:hypothetical protein